MYNPITCGGWDAAAGWVATGGCLSARLGFVLLFFIVALMRKWVFGLMGLPFNFIFSMILGMLSYLLMVIFTGSFRWAFLIGLVVSVVGGFLMAQIFGETDNS